jgi:NAD(P)-dependent dehydrogenase (short-subunit alcohol dehydrogenase family)
MTFRVFITGSADGLGLMAAQLLAEQGHEVILHARSEERRRQTERRVPGSRATVVGDLSRMAEMRSVAEQVNRLGPCDTVIHNAAVGYREPHRVMTEDGLPQVFAVNTLAPFVLTALIEKPRRLVYLSSGLHRSAAAEIADIAWVKRPWNGMQAYAESKLYDAMLATAVARRWPAVLSNAVEPGWVATKMGGSGATDDLDQGHRTQAWLAVSSDPAALVTGQYFFHLKPRDTNPLVHDTARQDELIAACERLSGIALPQ